MLLLLILEQYIYSFLQSYRQWYFKLFSAFKRFWKPLNRDSLKAGVHCIFARTRSVYSCTIEARCHGDIIPLARAQVFTFYPQIKQCKQQCRIDSVPSFNGETEYSNVHNAHLMRCMKTQALLSVCLIFT